MIACAAFRSSGYRSSIKTGWNAAKNKNKESKLTPSPKGTQIFSQQKKQENRTTDTPKRRTLVSRLRPISKEQITIIDHLIASSRSSPRPATGVRMRMMRVRERMRMTSFPIHPPLQPFHPRPESLHYIPYVPHLVELGLQLVDLPQDISEAGDFSVGGGDGAGGTGGLVGDGALGLCCELCWRKRLVRVYVCVLQRTVCMCGRGKGLGHRYVHDRRAPEWRPSTSQNGSPAQLNCPRPATTCHHLLHPLQPNWLHSPLCSCWHYSGHGPCPANWRPCSQRSDWRRRWRGGSCRRGRSVDVGAGWRARRRRGRVGSRGWRWVEWWMALINVFSWVVGG